MGGHHIIIMQYVFAIITTRRESCGRALCLHVHVLIHNYVCIRKGAAHAVITYVCVSNTHTESCGRASWSYTMCACISNIHRGCESEYQCVITLYSMLSLYGLHVFLIPCLINILQE